MFRKDTIGIMRAEINELSKKIENMNVSYANKILKDIAQKHNPIGLIYKANCTVKRKLYKVCSLTT